MTKLDPTTLYNLIDSRLMYPLNSKQFSQTYPPYNQYVDRETEEEFLEIAVTGFDRDDISITVNDDERKLSVEAKADTESVDFDYVVRSLAKRSFVRTWRLAPGSEVLEASLDNGVLKIRIGRTNEASTSRKIDIN